MPDPLRVLIHNDVTAPLVARLTERFPDVHCVACESYDALPNALSETRPDVFYGVRFAGTVGYPRDALLGTDGPRWISVGGAGTDHLGSWDPARVTVTNASGVAAEMMAEYMLGGFMHFSLDVPGLQADKAARRWDASRQVVPLRGKTLLIVGLGETGKALAARAKAFGMQVLGTRARPQPMAHVDEVHPADALTDLVGRADCIAVCVPLVAQTRGLIDRAVIAAMKPGVLFADVSRGGVVDQSALAEGLAEGRIGGAALDVFETEPLPEESPLWGLDRVLLSPHCSSVYDGWERASFERFLDNLERFRAGAPLTNIVDPARGY